MDLWAVTTSVPAAAAARPMDFRWPLAEDSTTPPMKRSMSASFSSTGCRRVTRQVASAPGRTTPFVSDSVWSLERVPSRCGRGARGCSPAFFLLFSSFDLQTFPGASSDARHETETAPPGNPSGSGYRGTAFCASFDLRRVRQHQADHVNRNRLERGLDESARLCIRGRE